MRARSLRRFALALALLPILAPGVRAQVVCATPLGCPDAGNSTIPTMILLVGHDGSGTPDPAGTFLVVFRDLANNPIPGAAIRVELTATDVGFCATQAPGVTLGLPTYVEGTTDENGVCRMTLRGSGSGPPQQVPGGPRGASVYGNGVLLGSVTVAAADLDGSGGAGVNDLSAFLGDFGTGLDCLREDFDASGFVGANDLAVWLQLFGAGLSSAGCTP